MKRLVSILLCLVLVFSFSVTSFAYDSAYETDIINLITDIWLSLDGVNGIENSVYSIMQDVDSILGHSYNSLLQLVDINEFTRLTSEYDEQILVELRALRNNLLGENNIWLKSLGHTLIDSLSGIQSDLDTLVDVLADPDDVALKDSQKNNQEAIQENFFTPGSDTSIDFGKISNVADLSSDFLSSFDTSKVVGNSNPLDLLGDGSDFSRWFSTENGQAMDPDYGVGSGGGGTDVPAPPSGPVYQGKNVLPYAVSNLVTGTIYNGKGFKNFSSFGSQPYPENDVYSDFYSTTGYIELKPGDTVYIVNMDFSDGVIYNYYGSSSNKDILFSFGTDLTDFMASVLVDENGVLSWTPDDMDYQSILAIRIQSALISPATYITINEYPLANVEPPEEPEPDVPSVKNWLPLATSTIDGSSVYNGIGWKPDTRLNSSNKETASSGMCLTGYIPVTPGDVVYTYNFSYSNAPATCYFYKYSPSGSYTFDSVTNYKVDSNGVASFVIGANQIAVRISCSGITSDSIVSINEYPILETRASVFSLRASAPEVNYSDEVVTSYYQDRMNEFYNLLGGLNNG